MAFLFASPIDVEIRLEGEDERKQVEMKGEKEKMAISPVYFDGESVTGQVSLSVLRCAKANLRIRMQTTRLSPQRLVTLP